MAVASEPDNTPLPGTLFTPRQVRMLKIAVIVMGILLVGGFALVLATMVYQASQSTKDTAVRASIPAGVEAELAIPPGATVTSLALDGDRLALHLQSSEGAEIAVIDLKTGQVLSRVRLKNR
jgi:undecaprenyl pyrophosphate phosphatase UppP